MKKFKDFAKVRDIIKDGEKIGTTNWQVTDLIDMLDYLSGEIESLLYEIDASEYQGGEEYYREQQMVDLKNLLDDMNQEDIKEIIKGRHLTNL